MQPKLFGSVRPQAPIARQEVFGPVLSLTPFDDEAEAVALANGTEYGLVAGVGTGNIDRSMRVARGTHCGQVFVNGFGAAGGSSCPSAG